MTVWCVLKYTTKIVGKEPKYDIDVWTSELVDITTFTTKKDALAYMNSRKHKYYKNEETWSPNWRRVYKHKIKNKYIIYTITRQKVYGGK